jgi:hypothetical protein
MGPPVLEPGGSKWMRRQHAHLLAGHDNWQLATESASFLFDHVADVVEVEPTDWLSSTMITSAGETLDVDAHETCCVLVLNGR